jgi:hypothetical protein
MPTVNVNDRASLERAYPEDAFANDAAQNELVSNQSLRGVRVESAPDDDGSFALERAARNAGEPATPDFLTPVRRSEKPRHGYQSFLDDIVEAAKRHGFRAEESPGLDEPRLHGLRQ